MKLESEFHVGSGRPCKACRVGENVDGKRKYDIEYRMKIQINLYKKNNREILNKSLMSVDKSNA
jgi:hypothetical protein